MIAPDAEFGTVIPYFLGIRQNIPQPEHAEWLNTFDMNDSQRTQLAYLICLNAEAIPDEILLGLTPFFAKTIDRAWDRQDFDFLDKLVAEIELRIGSHKWEELVGIERSGSARSFFESLAHTLDASTGALSAEQRALCGPAPAILERILPNIQAPLR